MNYDSLLFSELRMICVHSSVTETSDERIALAITANDELLSLGFTLSPSDIIKLSVSDELYSFPQRVRSYIGDVKAKPMYPDFPSQIIDMDDAVFRFHQLVHYLSTYGVEEITGIGVSKGWLPEVKDTEKTQSDDKLLNAKVLQLIDVSDKYKLPYRKILTRTERIDDKQKLMIRECLKHLDHEYISSVKVTFKQNLLDVFNTIFTDDDLSASDKLDILHLICQHTGDVWKCMDYALTHAKFHFRTSQKRLIVKLFESYPAEDFKANLILSNKKAQRTLLMLKYIDFNEYSRSKAHKDAVSALRSGALDSWESRAKYLVQTNDPEAINYYAQRPGIMLRNLTYLFRHGYSKLKLSEKLTPQADTLKTQTLISLVSHFSRPYKCWNGGATYAEALQICDVVTSLLSLRLSALDTVIKGRKVYIDMPGFDLKQSSIRTSNKSSEGGYIRSGLAYKIPENVRIVRFFVYWNDKTRVDVDLHTSAYNLDGSRQLIGWNADFKADAFAFSGDITHSDAAEYIDIDLEKGKSFVDTVTANINLFSGYNTFGEIDECYVGAMAVSKTGEKVKLYDPKNCFFTHYLTGKYKCINYGYVDVQNRVIVFDGVENAHGYYDTMIRNNSFSLYDYLEMLFKAQNVIKADSADEADLILVMGKQSNDNEISLIDNNFFMQ